MSLQKFNNILHELERDQQYQDLWNAILLWCNELYLYQKIGVDHKTIISYIEEWQNEYKILVIYQNIASAVWEGISHLSSNFRSNNQESEINKNYTGWIEKMNIKYILLIAFVLTGVGVGLYLLDQNKKKSKRNRTSRPQPDYDRTSLPEPTRQLQPNILILVINAENNETIIETLKRESKVTSENWENLYNSMEALWMGEKSEFNGTGLERNFLPNENSEPSESEYDVYFIKIELKENIQGFEKNRNSLERFDAFEALSKKEHKVIKISPRLSIRSTENSYLYR